jgi:hypothetical protein
MFHVWSSHMVDEDGNMKFNICQDSDLHVPCYKHEHLNYGYIAQKTGFNIFHYDFPSCHTRFNTQSEVIDHYRQCTPPMSQTADVLVLEGISHHVCAHLGCYSMFASPALLNDHQLEVHEFPHQCEVQSCGARFKVRFVSTY